MAMIAPHLEAGCTALENIPCRHDENKILSLSPDDVELVNGIGSLPGIGYEPNCSPAIKY